MVEGRRGRRESTTMEVEELDDGGGCVIVCGKWNFQLYTRTGQALILLVMLLCQLTTYGLGLNDRHWHYAWSVQWSLTHCPCVAHFAFSSCSCTLMASIQRSTVVESRGWS
jgi:hypothetical protein